MMLTFRKLVSVVVITLMTLSVQAQPPDNNRDRPKPYKILTTGKRITIKSTKNIHSVIVWTASGQRIVEQKDLNEPSFTFTVGNVNDKVLFVMIRYENTKPFTEKIGI